MCYIFFKSGSKINNMFFLQFARGKCAIFCVLSIEYTFCLTTNVPFYVEYFHTPGPHI
jgi:hypothetical protein